MNIKSTMLLLTSVVVFSSASQARDKEPYCSWKGPINEARLDASDDLLLPLGSNVSAQIAEHLPSGLPSVASAADSSETLLAQPDYIIWYDKDLRAPIWTAHHLTGVEATASPPRSGSSTPAVAEKRADSFRSDPRLKDDEKSTCKNYKEPIFDQGHMVPNADLDFLSAGETISRSMDHTFLMSNMTPQHCAFNRGPWQVLEGLIRDWASQDDHTWIITGAIYDRDGQIGRDDDNDAWRMKGKSGSRLVAIPSDQYKIIAKHEAGVWKAISFLLPNNDTLVSSAEMPKYLADHISSLKEIEDHTGIRFLEGLEPSEATEIWSSQGSWPPPLTSRCKKVYPER